MGDPRTQKVPPHGYTMHECRENQPAISLHVVWLLGNPPQNLCVLKIGCNVNLTVDITPLLIQ